MNQFSLHGYHPLSIDARTLSSQQKRDAFDFWTTACTIQRLLFTPIDLLSALSDEEKRYARKKPTTAEQAKSPLARKLAAMSRHEREQWARRTQYARLKFADGQHVWFGDGSPTPCSDEDLTPKGPRKSIQEAMRGFGA